jgi:hypothetical protein
MGGHWRQQATPDTVDRCCDYTAARWSLTTHFWFGFNSEGRGGDTCRMLRTASMSPLSVLQRSTQGRFCAVCRPALLCAALCRPVLLCAAVCCCVLLCTIVCCPALLFAALCRPVPPCAAVCRCVPLCAALCCSLLTHLQLTVEGGCVEVGSSCTARARVPGAQQRHPVPGRGSGGGGDAAGSEHAWVCLCWKSESGSLQNLSPGGELPATGLGAAFLPLFMTEIGSCAPFPCFGEATFVSF